MLGLSVCQYHLLEMLALSVQVCTGHAPSLECMCAPHAYNACLVSVGADWARLNVEQNVARRNMLQLYGNKKWLFDRSQLHKAASRHALPSIFVIQASFPIKSAVQCYHALPL